mgnify:FL=1
MGAVRVSGVRVADNLHDYPERVASKRKGNRKNDKLGKFREAGILAIHFWHTCLF